MSTPTLPEDPDNDGYTQWYAIRYPKPGESVADAQRQLEALAVTVDTALRAIATEFAGAATQAYVRQVAAPASQISVVRVAGVVTQIVETRPDGSQRLYILRYSNDRLVSVTRYNPSAVDTLTYNGAGYFTGFTTVTA